jgi:hypothetical protein
MCARLTEVARRLNDQTWCAYTSDLLQPYAGRIATEAVSCWGAVDRYLGLAAQTLGDIESAIAHLEDAITINERIGAVAWKARSHLDLARALGQRKDSNDRERPVVEARRALDTATHLGIARYSVIPAHYWTSTRSSRPPQFDSLRRTSECPLTPAPCHCGLVHRRPDHARYCDR